MLAHPPQSGHRFVRLKATRVILNWYIKRGWAKVKRIAAWVTFRPKPLSDEERDSRHREHMGTELLIIYDPDRTWIASASLAELQDNLPLACRFHPASRPYRWIGAIVGVAVGWGVFTGIWMVAVPNLIFSSIAGLVAGFVPGGIWGYFLGGRIAEILLGRTPWAPPKPFWLIRRRPGDVLEEEVRPMMRGPAYREWHFSPIVHTGLLGRDPSAEKPGVFLASRWFDLGEARAVRRFFTAPRTFARTVQIVSFATIALCMVAATVFLILATMPTG